jgi:hypothetical protein
VTLSITDTPSSGEASTSNTATFVVPVLADMPPCLQVTDPDAFRQLIFITSSDQDSRTFKVVSVADDCEPYPVPTSSAKQASQFVWSVYDTTRSPPAWLYPDNTTDSFTVSHSMFPNVRLNDAIEVRVEVRDKAVQKSYQTPGYSACSPDVDICCSGNVCSGDNSCIRWTTWSVYFTP